MENKKKLIVVPVIIAVAVIIIFIAYRNSVRITQNPADAIGNTAGNLNSGCLFCENDGIIYFANPYDDNKLYSMKSDCSDIKKINDDTVSYINSKGRYIYYTKNNRNSLNNTILRGEIYGVVRCRLNGGQYTTLNTGYCTDLSLTGNTLVYNTTLNGNSVTQTIGINGKDGKTAVASDLPNASVKDGHLFYAKPSQINSADHAIYDLNLKNGISLMYCNANAYMATLVNNVLYYIDLDNNYALTAVDLSTNKRRVIVSDKVVFYNVYDTVIYYQEESYDHSFNRIRTDGTDKFKITDGDVASVSCTSLYTFYQMAGSNILYRLETRTGTRVQTFIIK